MSSFGGLSVGLSGLYAQRRGLDVSGQNVANVNTDGYSRQRVTLESMGAPVRAAVFSTWRGGGGGVAVSDVTRVRDMFLEARGQQAHATSESLAAQQIAYSRVEQLFAEPSETGFSAVLNEFWAGFDDVANKPSDRSSRSQLLQRAESTVDWLQQTSAEIESQWNAGYAQLTSIAGEVNLLATRIAELNDSIVRGLATGSSVNELADQRDGLAMRISELVGSTSQVQSDGSLSVSLGGVPLVSNRITRTISVSGSGALGGVTAGTPVGLTWDADNNAVNLAGGRMGGIMEALNRIIPEQSLALDGVAATLASEVNAQHRAGFDLGSNPGGDFFTGSTASSIAVAFTDPALVAASSSAGAAYDGSNADAMAKISQALTGPDVTYRSLVVDLGVQSQTISSRLSTQTSITNQIDSARDSEAGVNLDEEMTSLLQYQRAYEAAARVITTIDQNLDVLINRTGMVGR